MGGHTRYTDASQTAVVVSNGFASRSARWVGLLPASRDFEKKSAAARSGILQILTKKYQTRQQEGETVSKFGQKAFFSMKRHLRSLPSSATYLHISSQNQPKLISGFGQTNSPLIASTSALCGGKQQAWASPRQCWGRWQQWLSRWMAPVVSWLFPLAEVSVCAEPAAAAAAAAVVRVKVERALREPQQH